MVGLVELVDLVDLVGLVDLVENQFLRRPTNSTTDQANRMIGLVDLVDNQFLRRPTNSTTDQANRTIGLVGLVDKKRTARILGIRAVLRKNPGGALLSHGRLPQYPRHWGPSLPCSEWERVLPPRHGHQGKRNGRRVLLRAAAATPRSGRQSHRACGSEAKLKEKTGILYGVPSIKKCAPIPCVLRAENSFMKDGTCLM